MNEVRSLGKNIEEKCNEYLLEEPDGEMRAQIHELLSQGEKASLELENRMLRHLGFGTAGLRASMQAGYNRMNLVTVYRFCYALGTILLDQKDVPIVIGFDARLNSKAFALDAANILASLGLRVHVFSEYVPTPLCAYAVKHLGAQAGVMITASHNPRSDNGIKLFNDMGAQASGPILRDIEQGMADAVSRHQFFRDYERNLIKACPQKIGDEIFVHYLEDIKETRLFAQEEMDHDVDVVYTALHGVGERFFLAAALEEGFGDITSVRQQAKPDGRFPTLSFPNPEEDDALDLAHEFARAKKASWVFATDPDADRLQVSVKDTTLEFRKLSGNEMGAILGYFAIKRAKQEGIYPLVASSIVSSRMLRAISKTLGAHYVEGLTGFSNIVARALEAQAKTKASFVFAYEEAIGFLLGQVVLDKDGINAGARFMEIAGFLKKCKRSIWDLLDELYQTFGIFVNKQWSVRWNSVAAPIQVAQVMNKVRSLSESSIAALLDCSECKRFDLAKVQLNNAYEGLHANVVIFEIDSLFRFIVRPSGTEPKIKFYLELSSASKNTEDLCATRMLLEIKLEELKNNIGTMLAIF